MLDTILVAYVYAAFIAAFFALAMLLDFVATCYCRARRNARIRAARRAATH